MPHHSSIGKPYLTHKMPKTSRSAGSWDTATRRRQSLPQGLMDIRGITRVVELAKLGTTLPLPIYTTYSPVCMCLQGPKAPTPAKKWIGCMWAYGVSPGVH